ncbi:uncharacterized protein LOC142336103 [Convolutriloba macropyga]|uniref:uncharacterized protein LOC142336103 n=1 Tax=Convolutriloba macropyga TaxID=536237 RepID=UPI003F522BDA
MNLDWMKNLSRFFLLIVHVLSCVVQISMGLLVQHSKGGLDRLTRDDNKYFLSYPDQPQQQQQRFSINPDRDYNSAYIQAGPNNQYNGMDNGHQSWQNGYNQPNIKTIRQTIKCYACVSNDPEDSCVAGNVTINGALHTKEYGKAECDGYCFVKKYTAYGTTMQYTQRGCYPDRPVNEVCLHSRHENPNHGVIANSLQLTVKKLHLLAKLMIETIEYFDFR